MLELGVGVRGSCWGLKGGGFGEPCWRMDGLDEKEGEKGEG